MAKHPYLTRRGSVFWFRRATPSDIKDSYGKREERFSLETTDPQEALRKVKIASVEVDQRFEIHRKKLQTLSKPPRKELSGEEIKKLADLYYALMLDEDAETRLEGFFDEEDPELPSVPVSTFEEYEEAVESEDKADRYQAARGKVFPVDKAMAEEILELDSVGIRLADGSPSWKKLILAFKAASIKAHEAIRQRNVGDVVETPPLPDSDEQVQLDSSPLMSLAVQEWVEEKVRTSWTEGTRGEIETWVGHFIAVAGDKPIRQYTKADARRFKSILLNLPSNSAKRKETRGLPIDKAAKAAKKLGMKPMSDRNLNKLLGFVGSFFTWAEQNFDEAPGRLFSGLSVKVSKTAREERDPFTPEQLEAIFSSPIYTGCKSIRKWKEEGSLIPKDSGIYWTPLIALYSGMRMGEVLQLYVEDIKEEDGILYFDINADGDDKNLKTVHSKRLIPVHKALVEAGLLDLVVKRREQDEKRLFPDMKKGKGRSYAAVYSKHFRRQLEAVGAKTSKTTFHSFRHNFEDACRDSDIPKEIMDALQGHGEKGMSGRYGSGYSLHKLSEAMEKLSYRDLDLRHLEVK